MSEIIVSKISGLSNVVVGNSTVNVAFTSAGMTASNSSSNTVISPSGISINGENVSPTMSFRNKIINGNFDIWQRETSNTSVLNNQYLADRWVTLRANTTANVAQQTFTLGQTDVPGEPTYFYRTTTTSNTNSGAYCLASQRIESVRTLAGRNAVLTFWAKADNTKNIAVELMQYFGATGSPSANVTGIGVTTCALTTSWQKFTIPVAIPSISGKTLGSDSSDYLALNFWFDAGSTFNSRTNSLGQQSGVFDIARVQLEEGTIATPFEERSVGLELTLCQRYYSQWAASWTGFAHAIGEMTSASIHFKQTFRFTPTLGILSQTNSARWGSGSASISGLSPSSARAQYTASTTGGNETWSITGSAESEL